MFVRVPGQHFGGGSRAEELYRAPGITCLSIFSKAVWILRVTPDREHTQITYPSYFCVILSPTAAHAHLEPSREGGDGWDPEITPHQLRSPGDVLTKGGFIIFWDS